MRKHKNIVIVAGTYKTREGTEKKRYQTIGTVFIADDGNLKIKIDSMPLLDGGWNGWANCYDIEEKSQKRQNDDDLPF